MTLGLFSANYFNKHKSMLDKKLLSFIAIKKKLPVNPDTKQVAGATEKSSWINGGKRETKKARVIRRHLYELSFFHIYYLLPTERDMD